MGEIDQQGRRQGTARQSSVMGEADRNVRVE